MEQPSGEIRTRPIASGRSQIPSIRHQGYHTPYALAELIDNSVQAKSKHIEVLCMDKKNIDTGTDQLQQIAILDDGTGMTKNELWDSIRLGESQNRGRGGIGYFGVGLTHASLSQCKRLDVYSWQTPDQVFHVYLDLDEVENSNSSTIDAKEPLKDELPDIWKKTSKYFNSSGTLVVWSNLDKCKWKKASTLINNSNFDIGRLYRKFIHDKNVIIRMTSFNSASGATSIDKNVESNDPLYLMSPSSTPSPWNKEPMFQRDGNRWEEVYQIKGLDGNKHKVVTRYSFVKREAREGKRNSGSTEHGKHASNNIGVSIIRAGRELKMDLNLLISYEPTERWWGAEIEFPPELDSIFGVSTNKQSAEEFSYMTKLIGKQNRESGSKKHDDETKHPLYDIVLDMSARIRNLRNSIPKPFSDKIKKSNPEDPPLEPPDFENLPSVTNMQRSEMTKEQRKEKLNELYNNILNIGTPLEWQLDQCTKFEFANHVGNHLFDVRLEGGLRIIIINTGHKAYIKLFKVLLENDDLSGEEAKEFLKDTANGIKILLAAWARIEDLEPDPDKRNEMADMRFKWGLEINKSFELVED